MDRRQPLAGLRVVVTRPEAGAGELAALLVAEGAAPLLCPTIRIAPPADSSDLDAALNRLAGEPASAGGGGPGWIVFASANAVAPFVARLTALGHRPEDLIGSGIGAVGPKTAAALAAHGLRVDLLPPDSTARALASAMGDVAGQRILLPQADIARPEIAQALRALGAEVDAVVTYRTVPAEPDAAVLAELQRGFDVVTFASGSAVRGFMRLLEERLPRALLAPARIACIGPATAAVARELSLVVHVEADQHTAAGLVAALVEAYQMA